MKVLTNTEFEAYLVAKTLTIQYGWGTGNVFSFIGAVEGESDILFKVAGL